MDTPLTSVRGIGPAAAAKLMEHGFGSAEALASTTVEALSKVPGFGTSRSLQTIADANSAVAGPPAAKSTDQAGEAGAKKAAKPKRSKKKGAKGSKDKKPKKKKKPKKGDKSKKKAKKNKKGKKRAGKK